MSLKFYLVNYLCCLISTLSLLTFSAQADVNSSDNSTMLKNLEQSPEIDFGEEGDVILKVYLRDLLLTDGLFAIIKNGAIYLPLAELSTLLDFPIVVDPITGKANGWYLEPQNTFSLDLTSGIVLVKSQRDYFSDTGVFSDDIDIFVDSKLLQDWLPLFFDVSLSAQVLSIRSTEMLPKELARERSERNVENDVVFAATKEYDIPGYRLLDWPELNVNLGGFYAPELEYTRLDYRVRANGDFAFMNGKLGISGNQDQITGASITLGRSDPRGMLGPLRIADFEFGDTSQFLPGMIGSSLSGRGLRFGNTQLADQRDLDTIDLQGEQQAGYEVELYVNDRLRGVDRDSGDNSYNFQQVPLQLGQNNVRLEFYGPEGQRLTETQRNFVGGSQARRGNIDYEIAIVEPGQRVFDLFDQVREVRETGELPDISLSSAFNFSYGLTRRTGLGFTIASLATDSDQGDGGASDTENQLYINARLSTDLAGVLMSNDVTVDPNGNLAGQLAARTTLSEYEIGISQRLFQSEFRNTDEINSIDSDSLPRNRTSANLSRQFFQIPTGRLSYGANASYQQNHAGDASASIGTRLDYQTKFAGLSWSHNHGFDLAADTENSSGQVGARLHATDSTGWSLNSHLSYSDDGGRLVKNGSLRAALPIARSGSLNVSATRDLELSSTRYSASWNRQYRPLKISTAVTGTSSDDISMRVGVEMTARRYPNRWLPAISSSGGDNTVAVQVFGDDNNNGIHDKSEPVLEGIRLTRNGLMTGVATDSNGVALLTGLANNTPVDVGILESDIKEPSLKFNGIEKGVLSRPGRIPLVAVALQRATDIEGSVTVAGATAAPNVRMVLTPVKGGDPMEIYTEYDGFYYLSHVPLGVYDFGPDPKQLESAGLIAQPATKRLVLENLDSFPPPENFNLIRLTDNVIEPEINAALPGNNEVSSEEDVSWVEVAASYRGSAPKGQYAGSQTYDSDGDGVPDVNDSCQHTGRGSTVNEYGCVHIGEQLSSLTFAPDSDSISTDMAFELNGLARELKANPSLNIVVETHSDNSGNAMHNMELAKRRARSIIQYLDHALRVSLSQLSGIAMGEAKPVASNRSRAGRKMNRRVVIRLTQ